MVRATEVSLKFSELTESAAYNLTLWSATKKRFEKEEEEGRRKVRAMWLNQNWSGLWSKRWRWIRRMENEAAGCFLCHRPSTLTCPSSHLTFCGPDHQVSLSWPYTYCKSCPQSIQQRSECLRCHHFNLFSATWVANGRVQQHRKLFFLPSIDILHFTSPITPQLSPRLSTAQMRVADLSDSRTGMGLEGIRDHVFGFQP